jgi:L-asparagine transporter-like permease
MNAVILSSVLSAGNHALFAGTRVLYSLAQPLPAARGHAVVSGYVLTSRLVLPELSTPYMAI